MGVILDNLAQIDAEQGKHAEAEALYKRALAIKEKALGTDHPQVAFTLSQLAITESQSHQTRSALDNARRATAAVIGHAATEAPGAGQKSETKGLVAQRAAYFLRHVAYLDAAVQEGIEPLPGARREALEIAQWATNSSTAAAVQQMGLRLAVGSNAFAALVRERQDLSAFWRKSDEALTAAVSQPQGQQNPTEIAALRGELAATERKLAGATARIEREFPDYAALASPAPLRVQELQKLLGGDEALVFLLSGVEHWETYVFAVTRDEFEWKTIPLKTKALEEKVAAFRRGLDVDALARGLQRAECTQSEADKRGLSRAECEAASGRELFDLGLAHELYETLVGPVEPLIRDKKHLIVVPSGALTALPFHLLVTEKPAVAVPPVDAPRDLASYRDAAWLLRRHAVSVLPSVASLKALRTFARKDEAKQALIGFGDPVFNAEDENSPAESRQNCCSDALLFRVLERRGHRPHDAGQSAAAAAGDRRRAARGGAKP